MNGSTSTVPLAEAIASVLLGESREDVADLVNFSRTTQSYRSLMYGESDILIAAEPADAIWDEKKAMALEWEMEPFAVDGLVFITNENNPVDSLTTEQIQKIYTGEITNWKEVGGDDLEIVPFQRNEEAGSQTAMKNLVMKDLKMMDPPTDYVAGSMGGLIEGVAAYDGSAAAIGYTVYYYANDMKMADGLKILKVNGVEPNADTIRSGEYPFLNNYYVVISTALAEDHPARIMYNWILGSEGQRLVAHEGYVSVTDVGGGARGSTVRPPFCSRRRSRSLFSRAAPRRGLRRAFLRPRKCPRAPRRLRNRAPRRPTYRARSRRGRPRRPTRRSTPTGLS